MLSYDKGGFKRVLWSTTLQVTFQGHLILTGLLGPTIRAEVYDTVVITLKNMASHPVSLQAVGVSYWKVSEGKSKALLLSWHPRDRNGEMQVLGDDGYLTPVGVTIIKYLTGHLIKQNVYLVHSSEHGPSISFW
jgi:hypothetical protein